MIQWEWTLHTIKPAAIVRIPVKQGGILLELQGIGAREFACSYAVKVRNRLEALDGANNLSDRDQIAQATFQNGIPRGPPTSE